MPMAAGRTCVTDLFARRATLGRSVRLLRSFRFEQSNPDLFYGPLADDTADMVGDLWTARNRTGHSGRTILDVGGGPGYFATAFTDARGVGEGRAEFP